MNLIYKKIVHNDIEKASYLFIECFKQEPWNENWTYEKTSQRIHEILSSPYATGYVVYDDIHLVGIMIGRIMTFLDYREFWIDDFCISPSYQGKGLGSQFLKQVKNELKDISVSKITLNTSRGFLSDKFYKKNGFEVNDSIVTMHCQL